MLHRLECSVQHYPWGGRSADGRPPYIADLLGLADDGGKPWAELWIGAHPKLPARLPAAGGQPLDQWLQAHPVAAGSAGLPFLMKVLDSAAALSIQAHPDKALAVKLRARSPEHYPDANHKPEIALALSRVSAFCGFRRERSIRADAVRLPGLGRFLSGVRGQDWLRGAYARIFTATAIEVAKTLQVLEAEVRALPRPTPRDRWFLKLLAQYPGDRGTLCAWFLNLMTLRPGQALFIPANEPHAYLEGTMVECMASSDNVVRGGLTNKFIDRDVLLNMLSYQQGRPVVQAGKALPTGGRIYQVPADEFRLELWEQGTARRIHEANRQLSLLLILEGEAEFSIGLQKVKAPRGSIWLWPANDPSLAFRPVVPGTIVVRAAPADEEMASC